MLYLGHLAMAVPTLQNDVRREIPVENTGGLGKSANLGERAPRYLKPGLAAGPGTGPHARNCPPSKPRRYFCSLIR